MTFIDALLLSTLKICSFILVLGGWFWGAYQFVQERKRKKKKLHIKFLAGAEIRIIWDSDVKEIIKFG